MSGISFSNVLVVISAVAGAFFVGLQVRLATRQEAREFIASYNGRYMVIADKIPLGLFIEDLTLEEASSLYEIPEIQIRRAFFDYFELCEEQCNLLNERIGSDNSRFSFVMQVFKDNKIWKNARTEWFQGIRANMERKAFKTAFQGFETTLEKIQQENRFSEVKKVLSTSN